MVDMSISEDTARKYERDIRTTLKRAIRITALSLGRPLRICPKVGYVHLVVQAKTHLIRSAKDIFNPRIC